MGSEMCIRDSLKTVQLLRPSWTCASVIFSVFFLARMGHIEDNDTRYLTKMTVRIIARQESPDMKDHHQLSVKVSRMLSGPNTKYFIFIFISVPSFFTSFREHCEGNIYHRKSSETQQL